MNEVVVIVHRDVLAAVARNIDRHVDAVPRHFTDHCQSTARPSSLFATLADKRYWLTISGTTHFSISFDFFCCCWRGLDSSKH